MKRYTHQRGVALPIALMLLTILLVMTIGFTYDTRVHSAYNASIKVSHFYRIAAETELNEFVVGMDEWVTASPASSNAPSTWRFGNFLQSDIPDISYPEYGVLVDSSFPNDPFGSDRPAMNAGLLPLDYRIYVRNNRDDPAYYLAGADAGGGLAVTSDWDTDGKIILTVQVFNRRAASFNAALDIPVTTISAIIQPTGLQLAELPLSQANAYAQEDESGSGANTSSEDTATLSESLSYYNN